MQSSYIVGPFRLACLVGLCMILVACSDSITCWPLCGSSSSGVDTTTEITDTTTETTDTTTETTDTTTETTCTDVASITVTYPSGGETLGGGTHTVTWTKSCAVEQVRIDIYDNNNLFVRWLADKPVESKVDWEIQEANGLYRVKVTSDSDASVYDYSEYFLIKTHNDDHK